MGPLIPLIAPRRKARAGRQMLPGWATPKRAADSLPYQRKTACSAAAFRKGPTMKITGDKSHITFELEDGYVLKAEGELLASGAFLVYRDTMEAWAPPHQAEPVTQSQIAAIIAWVKKNTNKNTVKLIFK